MNKLILITIKKIALYVTIVLGLYFLYNPYNQDQDNLPHSSISFVYAQF